MQTACAACQRQTLHSNRLRPGHAPPACRCAATAARPQQRQQRCWRLLGTQAQRRWREAIPLTRRLVQLGGGGGACMCCCACCAWAGQRSCRCAACMCELLRLLGSGQRPNWLPPPLLCLQVWGPSGKRRPPAGRWISTGKEALKSGLNSESERRTPAPAGKEVWGWRCHCCRCNRKMLLHHRIPTTHPIPSHPSPFQSRV